MVILLAKRWSYVWNQDFIKNPLLLPVLSQFNALPNVIPTIPIPRLQYMTKLGPFFHKFP
jgi:hypothetical protein